MTYELIIITKINVSFSVISHLRDNLILNGRCKHIIFKALYKGDCFGFLWSRIVFV